MLCRPRSASLRRRAVHALVPLTVAVCAAAAACKTEPNARPTIHIISPDNDSSVGSSSVKVSVAVTKFTLDPTIVTGDNEGEAFKGHWHLYLDFNPAADVLSSSTILTEVSPGVHILSAELANQNEVPVAGVAVDSIQITIPDGVPSVSITSPAELSLLDSSSVDLGISVTNFTLDSANVGGANQTGHGHYHVFVGAFDDAHYVDYDTLPIYTLTRLSTEGSTAANPIVPIFVALANDDHTLVDPVVLDERDIIVSATSPRLSIVSPTAGAVASSSFSLTLSTANFTLTDFGGSPADAAGQGHYHVLVDGTDEGAAFATTSSGWSLHGSGPHRVRVELHANQDGPVPTGAVVDTVRLTAP